MGRSERRELRSRIGTIVEHLLKLQASSASDPANTIERTRREVADILADSPSLRREIVGIIRQQLATTRGLVAGSLARRGETPLHPPEAITYDEAQILGDWLPDHR